MVEKELTNYFESFLKKEPLFTNKKALQINYTPENIPHRDEQIKLIAGVLAPALRMEKPSNLFIYGKTGTGKTVCITKVSNDLIKIAEKNDLPLKILYLNCKLKRVADTEYRLIAQLTREFGVEVPATGLPTDEIYKIFIKNIDQQKMLLIIVLDEIDQLVKKIDDGILYNLTRLNYELKNTEISIIGISNDLTFTNDLDPRVKSSLSEEELVFPPYNAMQLQSILKERSKICFHEGAIEQGVIEKCAAYAARDHGDARRALELLRVAGEIAERTNEGKILMKNIDEAQDKIEKDRVLDNISTQPKQFKLTLYSIFYKSLNENTPIFTGDIYDIYKDACTKVGLKPLTQRRVSDIIAELDMLGIINANVISKGRYGRTREIRLAIPSSTVPKVKDLLKDSLGL
ncbi:MAG: ORC1-type DNA replication protein [Candidatus Nanoarchaeia archaeon]|nr:ORC1-type DNA replication protein [Candidatus Nanoarchaeia archaeon]